MKIFTSVLQYLHVYLQCCWNLKESQSMVHVPTCTIEIFGIMTPSHWPVHPPQVDSDTHFMHCPWCGFIPPIEIWLKSDDNC